MGKENDKEFLARQARLAKEEEEKRIRARQVAEEKEPSPQEEEKLPGAEVMVKPLTSNESWQKIAQDYKDTIGREPDKNGSLIFPDQNSATTFFTNQAELGREFLCGQIDAENKLTGQYVFSCGDKKLYSGTLEEIKNQLASDPNNAKAKEGLKK